MKLLLENWRVYTRSQLLLEGDAAAAFESEMENFMDTTVKKLSTIKVDKPQEKEELEEVAVAAAAGAMLAIPKIIQSLGEMVKWIEPKLKTFIGAGEKRRSRTTGKIYHTGEAKVGNAIVAFGEKAYKKYLGGLKWAIKKIGKASGADWDDAQVEKAAGIFYHILIALLFVQAGIGFTNSLAHTVGSSGTLNAALIKNGIGVASRGDSLADFAAKMLK